MSWGRSSGKVNQSDGVCVVMPDGDVGTAHRTSTVGHKVTAHNAPDRVGPIIEDVTVTVA